MQGRGYSNAFHQPCTATPGKDFPFSLAWEVQPPLHTDFRRNRRTHPLLFPEFAPSSTRILPPSSREGAENYRLLADVVDIGDYIGNTAFAGEGVDHKLRMAATR